MFSYSVEKFTLVENSSRNHQYCLSGFATGRYVEIVSTRIRPRLGEHNMGWETGNRGARDREEREVSQESGPEEDGQRNVVAEPGEVDTAALLNHPQYFEFLEAFGELTMPNDDGNTIDELLDGVESHQHSMDSSNDVRDGEGASNVDEFSERALQSTLADEFIAAISSEGVSSEQRTAIREALGLENRKRAEVQLKYLKSRFLELEAYIAAMEELFDSDVDPIAELESLRSDVSQLRDEIETTDRHQNSLERQMASIERTQTGRFERIEAELEGLRTTVERDVVAVQSDLRQISDWKQRLAEAVQENSESPRRTTNTCEHR